MCFLLSQPMVHGSIDPQGSKTRINLVIPMAFKDFQDYESILDMQLLGLGLLSRGIEFPLKSGNKTMMSS